jgi:general secretion pathway protein G
LSTEDVGKDDSITSKRRERLPVLEFQDQPFLEDLTQHLSALLKGGLISPDPRAVRDFSPIGIVFKEFISRSLHSCLHIFQQHGRFPPRMRLAYLDRENKEYALGNLRNHDLIRPCPSRTGFTLIELLVVIAIIAILSAVIAPNAYRAIEKAKIVGTIADYQAVKTAAMSFNADTGTWPADGIGEATFSGTNSFLSDPSTPIPGWDGPYLEKWPQLAKWGGLYTFQWDNAIDWDQIYPPPDDGRYVLITNVPRAAAIRIDLQLDQQQQQSVGQVVYSSMPTTSLYILVSTEVEVAYQ